METPPGPKISISLQIDPPRSSFVNPFFLPTLHLTITSHHPSPITIYADDLSPKLMLQCGAFIITDLNVRGTVPQCIRAVCRIPPPPHVVVPINESLFHTLLPNTPLTLSAPFACRRKPKDGTIAVLTKRDLAYYHCSHGTARHGACGQDFLEPGHKFALSMARDSRVAWNVVRWWEYGTKEEVLSKKNGDGAGLDGRQLKWGVGPHPPIQIDMDSVEEVLFECAE